MIECTFRELECFAAVAHELSFTNAAERMHLAQPALSRHIRSLETRLGCLLFDRTKRSVALTEAGRAFLADTRDVLPGLNRAVQAARRRRSGKDSRLELGFASAHANESLIRILRDFRRLRPDIALILHDLLPSEQLKQVVEGRIDGGFLGTKPDRKERGVRFIGWNTEPMRAFVPLEHPLAARRRILVRELSGSPFIHVSTEAAPFFNERLRKLVRRGGLAPGSAQEVSRAQAAMVLVAAGAGVTILPHSLHSVASGSVANLALSDGEATLTYAFACRANNASATLGAFCRFLETQGKGA